MLGHGSKTAVTLVAVLASLSVAHAQESGIRWAPDMESAQRASAQFKVPLLIHFYGDNCLPCRTLEERVYSQPQLIETLNKYFICVKVNGSAQPEMAAKYGVHSWPTDVFMSADGKPLYQGVCQQDLNGYLATLQNVAVRNRDMNLMLAAQQQVETNQEQVALGPNPTQSGMYSQNSGTVEQVRAAQQMLAQQQSVVQQTAAASKQFQATAQNAAQALVTNTSSYQSPSVGLPPINGVAQGPIAPANQPAAIAAAAPSQTMQTAGPAAPQSNNLNGALPAQQVVAQVQSPASPTAGRGANQLNAYTGMPTMTTSGAQSRVQPTIQTVAQRTPSGDSHTVNNPYYNPNGATQDNSAVAQKIATNPQPAQAYNNPVVGAVQRTEGPTEIDLPLPTMTNAQPEANATPVASPSKNSIPAVLASTQLQAQGADVNEQETASSASVIDAMSSSLPDETHEMPALEGYCPVELSNNETWVEGKVEFAVKHRGKVYWMSSNDAMQKFLATPDDASPVLSGYDPLVLLEEGRLVEGNIQYGLHEKISGKYLLFSTSEAKKKYAEDFDRYSKALKALLIKATSK